MGKSSTPDFATLQQRLLPIWQALEARDQAPTTSIIVPSLSFDKAELIKIQGVPFYEERLLFSLIRLQDPSATVVYVTSQPLHPEIVDYYLGLLRGVSTRSARSRLHLVSVYDSGAQPLTEKILARPRFVRRLRALIRDPSWAYLTVFNSTPLERELAIALGIPLNGVDPDLLWAGTKSGSRKIFERAGVDQAPGVTDITSKHDVVQALRELRSGDPTLRRAMIKLDESFAGAGNALFTYPQHGADDGAAIEGALADIAWASESETLEAFLTKLGRMGGVVEAFVEVPDLRSPSVQLRVDPEGRVTLLSTHEQVLGGPTGQTYLGCRFPADAAYRGLIQERALAIGEVLCSYGVVSRFAVDFLVFRTAEGWRALAVEINLRMGGTTPPFMALQFLTGGAVDPATGIYRAADGTHKYYYATDNLRSEAYCGLLPDDFLDILASHSLGFDPRSETGAVFHMIGALSQFGKLGVTCIGDSSQQADEIYSRVALALDRESGRRGDDDDSRLHPFELAAKRME